MGRFTAAVRAVEVVATGSYTTRCALIASTCLRCWVEAKALAYTIFMVAATTTEAAAASAAERSHFWRGVRPAHSVSSRGDCRRRSKAPTTDSFAAVAALRANSCVKRPVGQRSSTAFATESNLLAASGLLEKLTWF